MKKFYFTVLSFCLFCIANAQIVNVPDANFKAELLAADSTNTTAKNLAGDYFKIDADNDGEIQESEALNVSYLEVLNLNISFLSGIEFFTNLQELDCSSNQLTNLNVSGLDSLQILNCSDNILTTIDVSGLTNLQNLKCSDNQLTNLDVGGLTNLQGLNCSDNQITILNVSGLTNLQSLVCANNLLNNLNITGLANLQYVFCIYNQLSNIDLTGLTSLQSLNCTSNQLTNVDISGLVNLQNLYLSNNQLTNINVSGLTNLQVLHCSSNLFTNLDVSGLTNLSYLVCAINSLTNLNLSGLTNLGYLDCSINQLSNLDLSGLNLGYLDCSDNQLTNIDLNSLINLQDLNCYDNLFTNIDVSGLTNLQNLDCSFNLLTNLDVSGLTNLGYLFCSFNQLANLFIKNDTNEFVDFSYNPNLQYICADESQLTDIQSQINSSGYGATCTVNSYCSFTPGGTFYTIQGNNKFDLNSNGCDTLDVEYPNLKLNFSDGTTNGNLISNTSGNYSIPVQAGTHMITPLLQNPTYFNVSPTTATVTFPVTTSPFVQDFCITANGVHNDLEINLLPTSFAVPGFDANYKIIYKNNGTQTQSGSVNLNFNDDVLDLVIANPDTTSQSLNTLSWSFTNLLPFESREILVTLNLNSPIETPPLNSGDVLSYNATITALTDETPLDNTFTLNQTVVNSFDPNDKTCLEGNTITPAQVGEYVHYMIRFENTGTFPAENIVVKDIIDTTKFDMATLFPVSGSHNFITKISDVNKVEFIFQNINLPFDSANNDGYIAFKIKTKSALALGNTFSNLANIYFDYNFPIVTNTATTTVANPLSTQDFEFSNYFSIYPNPVKNSLNITTKQAIKVSSMSIYNTLGQVVQVVTNPTQTVDVSELRAGTYFVKIVSDNGVSGTKFVKE